MSKMKTESEQKMDYEQKTEIEKNWVTWSPIIRNKERSLSDGRTLGHSHQENNARPAVIA